MPRHQQVVRQWKLLRRLERATDGLSVAELADAEAESPRTIYRDLQALDEAGFPVYNDRSRWRLNDVFRARGGVPVALSDLLALRCARGALEALEGTPFSEGLAALTSKLDALLTPEMRGFARQMDEVFVGDRFGQPDWEPLRPVIDALNAAAGARESVEILYDAQRGGEAQRRVDPYNLWVHRNALYLIAWCHLRQAIRTFSVARVRGVEPTGERFTPRPEYDFDAFARERFRIMSEGHVATVRIWFAAEAALYVKERTWHPTQSIRAADDGGVELTMEVDGLSEVCGWVMGFGPRARVIEPAELRERVLGQLRGALWRYEGEKK